MRALSPPRVLATLAVACLGTGSDAAAQPTIEARPSLSLMQVYESNLWSKPSNRDDDVITRFTPGVEAHIRSPLWTVSGRYAADAERYARHPALTAPLARQDAALTGSFRPASRLALAGGAEFVSTRDPRELHAATGLAFARARARRFSTHASLTRDMNPLTVGLLEYAFSSDRLEGGYRASTHVARVGIERQYSPQTAVATRYRVQTFAIAAGSGTQDVTSHSLALRMTRALTRRTDLSLEAGPLISGDVVRPELSASMEWAGITVRTALSYSWSQSTVLGLPRPADVHALHASFSQMLRRSVEVRVAPGLFRSALAGLHADVYVLSAGGSWRVAHNLTIDLSADAVVQHGSLHAGLPAQTIPHHRALLRCRVAAPGRAQS